MGLDAGRKARRGFAARVDAARGGLLVLRGDWMIRYAFARSSLRARRAGNSPRRFATLKYREMLSLSKDAG